MGRTGPGGIGTLPSADSGRVTDYIQQNVDKD